MAELIKKLTGSTAKAGNKLVLSFDLTPEESVAIAKMLFELRDQAQGDEIE